MGRRPPVEPGGARMARAARRREPRPCPDSRRTGARAMGHDARGPRFHHRARRRRGFRRVRARTPPPAAREVTLLWPASNSFLTSPGFLGDLPCRDRDRLDLLEPDQVHDEPPGEGGGASYGLTCHVESGAGREVSGLRVYPIDGDREPTRQLARSATDGSTREARRAGR